jgi:spermidine synthase
MGSMHDADKRLSPVWTGFGVLLICFFLSGATGLIYQVIWMRMLGLVFGHTVYAITTVLSAFMAGLALGSFLFARISARLRNLVATYGWLEIGIGLYCALIPLLLWVAASVYLALHRTFDFSYDAFSFLQFLLVFVLLLVPTTMMGGTLPVLSQALARDQEGLARRVGLLYSTNTFGAVLGVVLGGYVLLPAFGTRATIAIAVAGNLVVGALAIVWSRRRRLAEPAAAEAPAAGGKAVRAVAGSALAFLAMPSAARWTVLALGISGAVSFAYEVAWTRALALVIGSSTYAFSAMLVAFLVGIAAGSALYSWLLGRQRSTPQTFALIQVGIAVAVILVLLVFERMPELFLVALRWSDAPAFVQFLQFLVSAAALLPSTLLIGATFPCAVGVAARASHVGQDVGDVYAVNTIGAIVGTVVTGFLLIPAFGVHGTLKIGVAVNLLVAGGLIALTAAPRPAWRWGALGAATATALVVLLLPAWDQRVMSAGPAVYGKSYTTAAQQRGVGEVLRSQRILFYRDGRSGTISVNQEGQHIFLRTNGKIDAGTAIDMPTQLMSGHLPMLLHPGPRRALVIGLGSGITVGAVAKHPVEAVDVVEIEPAVVEASRFFAPIHGNVLADPRVRTVIADGRNFLLTAPGRYDVIISEPSNPWIGGLASLFSLEFFQMARDHLEPGGVMLQWLQGYNLDPEDFRMVVATFRTVFPSVSIWNTIFGDYLLLGRVEPTPIDLAALKARVETNPGVWGDLDRFGIQGWSGILGYFMLGEDDTARFTAKAGLNTDDRLPLEFNAPRALYKDTVLLNWKTVHSFKQADLPAVTPESRALLEDPNVRYWIGIGYLNREVWPDGLAQFQRALQAQPGHRPSLLGTSLAYLRMGQAAAAFDLARQLVAEDPREAAAFYIAGLAAEALQSRPQAISLLQQAAALQPNNREVQAALQRLTADGRR